MKKIIFSILILSISFLVIQCNTQQESIIPTQSILISEKSKSIGINNYKNIKRNILNNQTIEDVEYELQTDYINGKIKIMRENENLKIKLEEYKKPTEKNELTFNKEEMSLTLNDGIKTYKLYTKNHYTSNNDYINALEKFKSKDIIIKTMLSSTNDIIGNREFFKSKPTISKEGFLKNIPMPKMVLNPCPPGSIFITETVFSGSRSVGTYESNNDLQYSCSNDACIGCMITIGTDCACVYDDYLCSCTSKGCGCASKY